MQYKNMNAVLAVMLLFPFSAMEASSKGSNGVAGFVNGISRRDAYFYAGGAATVVALGFVAHRYGAKSNKDKKSDSEKDAKRGNDNKSGRTLNDRDETVSAKATGAAGAGAGATATSSSNGHSSLAQTAPAALATANGTMRDSKYAGGNVDSASPLTPRSVVLEQLRKEQADIAQTESEQNDRLRRARLAYRTVNVAGVVAHVHVAPTTDSSARNLNGSVSGSASTSVPAAAARLHVAPAPSNVVPSTTTTTTTTSAGSTAAHRSPPSSPRDASRSTPLVSALRTPAAASAPAAAAVAGSGAGAGSVAVGGDAQQQPATH